MDRLEEKLKGVDVKTFARAPTTVRSSSTSQPNVFSPGARSNGNSTTTSRPSGSGPFQFQPHVSSNNSVSSQASHHSVPLPRPAIPQVGMASQQQPPVMQGSMPPPSYMQSTKTSGPRGIPLNRSQTSKY